MSSKNKIVIIISQIIYRNMFRLIIILIVFQQLKFLAQDLSLNDNQGDLSNKTFVEFMWSNDFVYETDYYYTNGFAFEVLGPWAKPIPINRILIPSSDKSLNQFGVTINQDIFTPQERVDVEKQLDGDRPFAVYLLLGLIKKTFDHANKTKVMSEIQVGVLGPAALGKETQNGIHDMLPTSSRVNGWENQISNSIAIQYTGEFYKTLYQVGWIEISGVIKGKLGIPYTQVEVGSILRFGYFDAYPYDLEMFSKNSWSVYFFAEVTGRAVVYNATLQGGLFSTSIYTLDEINRFVGNYNLGLSLAYKLFKLELATNFNTPEFPGALSHKWAYASIRAGF